MHTRKYTLIMLFIFVLSLACGCAALRKPAPPNEPIPNRTRADEVDMEKARHIADRVDDIDGVKQSTVVVAGSKAYIGLDMEQGIKDDEERLHEIENTVADRVKGTEDEIDTVYVSSDPGVVKRLKTISRGIARGEPVTEYARELTDIGQRIKPRNI